VAASSGDSVPPFRAALATLASALPGRAPLVLALLVLLGLAEGAGLLFLAPVLDALGLSIAGTPLDAQRDVLARILDALGIPLSLVSALAAYAAAAVLAAVLARWQTMLHLGLQHDLAAVLRGRLYRAILAASWPFLSKARSSDFLHLLTTESERAGAATYHLLRLAAAAAIAAIHVGFAWHVSGPIAIPVLAAGVTLALALKRRTRQSRAVGEGLSRAMKDLYGAASEHLGGMKTIRTFGADDRHGEIFRERAERVRALYRRAMRSQADVKCLFDIGSVLVLAGAVVGAVSILRMSPAAAVFLIYLCARLLPRISSLLQDWQGLACLLPSLSAIAAMEGRCRAAAEPSPDPPPPGTVPDDIAGEGRGGRYPAPGEGPRLVEEIRIECVSFSYGGEPAVRDLDLAIPAGETTAVIGPSGSGKTTLADIIVGLITPRQGRVRIDGTELEPSLVPAWRKRIGYVGQDPFLFHDTIRANLLWASPGATEDDLRAALRAAAADEFVGRLPKGLDTIVGDRGNLLSGGERQRLALARALLRKPDLLVLDEATSNLDRENERRIQEAVRALGGATTIIVITHRLTSEWGARTVHVLEDGRLVRSETVPCAACCP
jgi:ATP-binding cassette subfamily C protein